MCPAPAAYLYYIHSCMHMYIQYTCLYQYNYIHYKLFAHLTQHFRPCAMVVPDFELIAEIMLVAEGFIDARILAHKFLTLYTLCKDLLSKQDHYDWGLRAIKSVLVVAGSLKRGDRERPEDQVSLRIPVPDFNTLFVTCKDFIMQLFTVFIVAVILHALSNIM